MRMYMCALQVHLLTWQKGRLLTQWSPKEEGLALWPALTCWWRIYGCYNQQHFQLPQGTHTNINSGVIVVQFMNFYSTYNDLLMVFYVVLFLIWLYILLCWWNFHVRMYVGSSIDYMLSINNCVMWRCCNLKLLTQIVMIPWLNRLHTYLWYTYVCMYVRICVFTCVCTCVFVRACAHVCLCVCVCHLLIHHKNYILCSLCSYISDKRGGAIFHEIKFREKVENSKCW